MNQETHDEDPYAPIQHILRNQGGEWITLYTHAEDENGQLVVDRFNLYVCGPQPPVVTSSLRSTPPSPPAPTLCEPISEQSTASLPDFSAPPSRIAPVVLPSLSSIHLPPCTRSPPPQPWPDTPVPWTPDATPRTPPSLTAAPTELRPGELTASQHRHLEWWLRQTQTDPPRHPNRISPLARQQFRLPIERELHHHRHGRDGSCAGTGLHRAVRDYQVTLNKRGSLRGGARWGRDESPEREREREQDERDVQAAVWYGQRAEAEIQRREKIRAGAAQRSSVDAFFMPPTPPASPPWEASIPAPPPSPARSASPLSSWRTRSSQTADIPARLSSLRRTRYERPSALDIPSAADFIPPANHWHIPSSQVDAIMERRGPPSARRDRVSPATARRHRRNEIRRTRMREALYSPSEYSQPSPEGTQPSNSSTPDPASDSDSGSEESWATPMMGRSPTSSTARTVLPFGMRYSTPSLTSSPTLIPRSPSLPVSPVSRPTRSPDYRPSRDPFLTPMVSPLIPTMTPSSFRSSRFDGPIRSGSSFDNPFRSPYQTNRNPFSDTFEDEVDGDSNADSHHLNHDSSTDSFANTDVLHHNHDRNGWEATPLDTNDLAGFSTFIPGHGTRHMESIPHDPLPPQNYPNTIEDTYQGIYQDTDEEIYQQILSEDLDPSVLDEDEVRWLRRMMGREGELGPEQVWDRAEDQERQRQRQRQRDWHQRRDGDEDRAENADEPRWLTEAINRNRARIRDWDVTGNRGAVRAGDGYRQSPRLGGVNGDGEGRVRVVNGDTLVNRDGLVNRYGLVNGDTLINDLVHGTPQRDGLR